MYQKETHSNLSLSEIQACSKQELAILELNNPTIKNITFKAYNLFTTMDENYIQFRNELHMTKHKSLMEELQQNSYNKDSQITHSATSYISFGRELDMTKHKSLMEETEQKNYIKMFEGKTIEQFNSNFAKITYFINPKNLPKQSQYQHYRLAFRSIASNTNQRTLMASLLKKHYRI